MRIQQLVRAIITSATFLGALLILQAASAMSQGLVKDLGPQPLADALEVFAADTGLQVIYHSEIASGLNSQGAKAGLSAEETLRELLRETGLRFEFLNEKTITLIAPTTTRTTSLAPEGRGTEGEGKWWLAKNEEQGMKKVEEQSSPSSNAPKETKPSETSSEVSESQQGIPEVLVTGSKVLNMDIQRSRDDIQPYVVLDRVLMERSGASNVDELLRQRIPMNAQAYGAGQVFSTTGPNSEINLRGLGSEETLVLIDGHRAVAPSGVNGPVQSDLNGIPLSAIERIEILPTTSSGIYGGSATGGVVNVVLRRDYTGAEFKVSYEGAFESGAGLRRIEFGSGFALGDLTHVMLVGSYADGNRLRVADRNFVQRGRAAVATNNPLFGLSYGLIGSTSNIQSASGEDLTLDNGTSLGSPITFVPPGYRGLTTEGDDGAAFLANAGRYNVNVPDTAQTDGLRSGLINAPDDNLSLSLTVRQHFTEHVQGFLEVASRDIASVADNVSGRGAFLFVGADAPNNPFQQDLLVTAPIGGLDTVSTNRNIGRRVVGGVIASLPHAWRAEADYTWHRSRARFSSPGNLTSADQEAIFLGSLDVLRDTVRFPEDFALPPPNGTTDAQSTLRDAALRFGGPLWSLPGGALNVALFVEHRDESVDDFFQRSETTNLLIPSRSQSVDSAYVEIRVPLVSATNRRAGIYDLEAQVAGRHDRYEVNGATGFINLNAPVSPPVLRVTNELHSTDPTFGLRYAPAPDLMLRASYGTGFVPPSVQQLTPLGTFSVPGALFGLRDPQNGNAVVPNVFSYTVGGNASLLPEESRSWSWGVVLAPRFVPGLRLSIDYVKIEKIDNIVRLPPQQIVDNFPERITRGTPTGPAQPCGSNCIIAMDGTDVNIARAEVEAFDLALDYQLETSRLGTFDLFAYATRNTHFRTQTLATDPVVENVGVGGTYTNPLKFKANAGLNWQYGGWSAGWTASYYSSYLVADPSLPTSADLFLIQGSDEVPSQIYHDVVASYRFEGVDRLFSHADDLTVRLGVKNVFNKKPPLDAGFYSAGFYSPYGDPRLAQYWLSLTTSF